MEIHCPVVRRGLDKSLIDKLVGLITKLELWVASKGTAPRAPHELLYAEYEMSRTY